MAVGISTACFYPMYTEQALEKVAEMGIKTLEIFFNSPRELEPDFIYSLQKTIVSYSLRVSAIHPFTSGWEPYLLFSDYGRRFKDGLEYYKKYNEAACHLGASIVVIHGDRVGGILSEEEYFDRFGQLSYQSRSMGIITAQENVHLYRSSDPQFIMRMQKKLGSHACFVLDIKQCVRSGVMVDHMINAMGKSIYHIHVSDHDPMHSCLLPGKGKFDFYTFFRILESSNYKGDYILEVYNNQYQAFQELEKSTILVQKIYNLHND